MNDATSTPISKLDLYGSDVRRNKLRSQWPTWRWKIGLNAFRSIPAPFVPSWFASKVFLVSWVARWCELVDPMNQRECPLFRLIFLAIRSLSPRTRSCQMWRSFRRSMCRMQVSQPQDILILQRSLTALVDMQCPELQKQGFRVRRTVRIHMKNTFPNLFDKRNDESQGWKVIATRLASSQWTRAWRHAFPFLFTTRTIWSWKKLRVVGFRNNRVEVK